MDAGLVWLRIGDEPSGCIKCWETIEWLLNWWPLVQCSAHRVSLVRPSTHPPCKLLVSLSAGSNAHEGQRRLSACTVKITVQNSIIADDRNISGHDTSILHGLSCVMASTSANVAIRLHSDMQRKLDAKQQIFASRCGQVTARHIRNPENGDTVAQSV
jgi:hypothetical protein